MPRLTRRLTRGEPLVDLTFCVSTRLRDAMRAANLPPVAAVTVTAVIDTGATNSVIRDLSLAPLGISPTGFAMVHTASTLRDPIPCPTYELWLAIPDRATPVRIGDRRVIATAFAGTGVDALIGCDVLAAGRFTYDGPGGTFTLEF